ncbi:MAG: IS1 family transposase [Rhodospirillaceae bacterium]|nr:IS1 family transposase [Rhodospirillaceae bacterium]
MNKLPSEKRAQILNMMVEGMSIRSIARMTGASKNTIVKLLADAGRACADYQDEHLRGLKSKRLQLDEIWSFIGAKEKNVPKDQKGQGRGDAWTWTAIDADSKLIVSWLVGDRSGETARVFVCDLAERLSHRVQVTTDGHKAYLEGMDAAFAGEVDYAMLEKVYHEEGSQRGPRRYSPGRMVRSFTTCCSGNPDKAHISTSYAERQNLNIRMGLRRFTRLTNAFSKKVENHVHALSIYFMHYNFARIHQTLRVSPAMAAGVTDKLWSMEDVVRMVEAYENKTESMN